MADALAKLRQKHFETGLTVSGSWRHRGKIWRYDIQHESIQDNDIQHNDTQRKDNERNHKKCDISA